MPPRDEPTFHQQPQYAAEFEQQQPRLYPAFTPIALLLVGVLFGGGGAYWLKPIETREVEKVVEKPGPERVIERVVEKIGPERIVEKVVEKSGPERVVVPAKAIECPAVQTIIQRIVSVEEKAHSAPKIAATPVKAAPSKPRTNPARVYQPSAEIRWIQVSPPRRRNLIESLFAD